MKKTQRQKKLIMKNMYVLFFIFSFMFILNMPSVAEKNNSQFPTDQQFGCTCSGLKACEGAACLVELLGLGCVTSGGRDDAICMCKNGAMAHCTNWDEILNDSNCSQQKNDYEHNNYGNCTISRESKARQEYIKKNAEEKEKEMNIGVEKILNKNKLNGLSDSSCGDGNWPPGVHSCKQCCQVEYPNSSYSRWWCNQGCG